MLGQLKSSIEKTYKKWKESTNRDNNKTSISQLNNNNTITPYTLKISPKSAFQPYKKKI